MLAVIRSHGSERRPIPLNVSGVGKGSQQCQYEMKLTTTFKRLDGTYAIGDITAPIVDDIAHKQPQAPPAHFGNNHRKTVVGSVVSIDITRTCAVGLCCSEIFDELA